MKQLFSDSAYGVGDSASPPILGARNLKAGTLLFCIGGFTFELLSDIVGPVTKATPFYVVAGSEVPATETKYALRYQQLRYPTIVEYNRHLRKKSV